MLVEEQRAVDVRVENHGSVFLFVPLTQAGIDWMYVEHAKDGGVLSLGLDDMPAVMPPPGGIQVTPMPAPAPVVSPAPPAAPSPAPASEERLRILDLFRN